jgi:hypothetical protein
MTYAMLLLLRRFRFVPFLAALLAPLAAQTPTPQLSPVERPFDFYTRGPYRAVVPRPSEVLGYEMGEFYANYGAFERLLRVYAERAADRMRVFPTGRTHELRPMHVLAISSPANLARLDAIKAANQRLADPRQTIAPAELDRLIANQPVIVWLGYNIHGDEAAGTEAAMQVLYQLLASDEPALRAILDRVVVIMNPCQNPDGRERFVTWYNAHGIGRPETFAYEKENPWNVQGRLNHYYFDLNRDMLVTSQAESRNTGAAFLEWLPQVAADHHGETKEYFFPPAALPINPNLPRSTFETWLDRFGRGNAAAFDQQGWLFYVRDVFDVFYPGYWDSWPSLHGATGMTYETSGGGKRGRNYRRDDDTIMTLRAAIAKHFTASLATLATAAEHREARLRDFRQHFVDALAAGRAGDVQQFFLPPGRDPHRTAELVRVLLRNGVEVRRAGGSFAIPAAQDYHGSEPAARTLPAGTYIVDLAQPRGRMAKALLERDTPQDAAFIQRQEEKRARNRARGDNVPEDEYEFYDITAWTLPLTFGVEAYWTATPVEVTGELLRAVNPPPPPTLPRARSAYVFSPDNEASLKLALRLLGEGYRLATAVRPLHAGEREFIRGSLIARVERNPDSLHERIRVLATELGAAVHPVDSAFTTAGITGIGSESTYSLRPPKVAVLAGEPTSPLSYGALRFLLEQTYAVDYVPISVSALKAVRLAEFNVIVLPSGSASRYEALLGEGGIAKLHRWAEDGGTLICLGGASVFAAADDRGWTGAKLVKEDKPKNGDVKKDDEKKSEKDEAKKDEEDETEPLPVPGAILRATVNHDHFLSFGYEDAALPVLVNTDAFYKKTDTGSNVLTFEGENLRLSGYIWPGNTERLIRDTTALIDEPVGDGRIVLFADEPGYRQIWHGTTRMFINAILYGPGLRNEGASYYAKERE